MSDEEIIERQRERSRAFRAQTDAARYRRVLWAQAQAAVVVAVVVAIIFGLVQV